MGLHVQQVGQGPDVALVHGWAFNGRVWRELVASLMQDFRVTVVDLPGHGRSPEMPGAYTMEKLAQQVLALFQRPVTWVGWSLGAMVGLAAACLPHTAIARMVLIGATPRFARGPDWAHGLAPAQLREFAEALERDYRGTLVRFLSLHLGQERDARALLRRLRGDMFAGEPAAPGALRGGLAILQHADLRSVVSSIAVPVQLIHGERDKLVPLAAAEYLAARLPTARLDAIPACGHAPFLSHRQRVEQTLLRFLHE